MNKKDAEVVEQLLCQKIKALERIIETRLTAMDKALELQHKEYERRLDFLNGEAERLRQMQSTYLPREVSDKVLEGILQRIRDLETYRDTQIGKSLAISAGVSVAVAAIISLIIKLVA